MEKWGKVTTRSQVSVYRTMVTFAAIDLRSLPLGYLFDGSVVP